MLGKGAVAMGDGRKWLRIMAKLALELDRF
jgi:hypothetical protein